MANSHPANPKGNSPILKIVKDVKNLKKQQNQLSGHFDKWCSQRKKTIEILEEALKKLKTASKCANVARLMGIGMEFVKYLYNYRCLIESEVPIKKHKASHSANSSEGGKFLLILESCLSIPVVNLVESGFDEHFLSEVRAALEKDQELSSPINEWIRSTRDLEKRVVQTFVVSLTSTPIRKVISSINSIVEMLRSGKEDAALQEIQSIAGSKALDVLSELTSECDQELARILNKAANGVMDAPGLQEICTNGFKLGVASNPFDVISVLGIFTTRMLDDKWSGAVGIVKDAVLAKQQVDGLIDGGETQHSKNVDQVLEMLKKQLEEVSNVFNPQD